MEIPETPETPETTATKKDEANAQSQVYILEGEIAAGKTELLKALSSALQARGLRVCVIPEPVDRWREIGILQQFYQDPSRHGYGFQTYVYATRVLEIVKAVRAEPHADVYLLERSPATDQIFMELQRDLVAPVEMNMYYVWCETYRLILPLDLARAKVLYLKTSLDHCMRRLSQRHREGEVPSTAEGKKSDASATGGVSREYQARLRRAHEAFFLGRHASEFPGLPASPFPREAVLEVGPETADLNFRDAGPERERVVAAILKMMGY